MFHRPTVIKLKTVRVFLIEKINMQDKFSISTRIIKIFHKKIIDIFNKKNVKIIYPRIITGRHKSFKRL